MKRQKEEGRRGAVPSGLTREQERELSAEKGKMAEDLQGLERQAQEAVRNLSQSSPEASRRLRGALGELQQSEASTRLQTAADYIRRGGAPYVANSEEGVARALREFRDNVRQAEEIARNGGQGRQGEGGAQLSQALTRMEQLRRDLEKAAGLDDPSGRRGGQQPGQEGEGGQQGQGQQQGQQGQGQQGQGQEQGQGQQGQGHRVKVSRVKVSRVRANRVRANSKVRARVRANSKARVSSRPKADSSPAKGRAGSRASRANKGRAVSRAKVSSRARATVRVRAPGRRKWPKAA